MGLSVEMAEVAIKAAKKCLKKHDDGRMKIKELAKEVAEKLDDVTPKKVKKFLSKSDKFSVDGKIISLSSINNKRKEVGNDDADVAAGGNIASAKKPKKEEDAMPPSDMNAWRKQHKIVLKDTIDDDSTALNDLKEFYPYTTFHAASGTIPQSLLSHCTAKNGFTTPSPIQAQCWPVMLECTIQRDVVGIAETGSGKTLAFAMPALTQMSKEMRTNASKKRAPRMLVLAPTRELAMQSHDVLEEFGAVVQLTSLVVYGGVPKYTQVAELKKGTVDCIVATPGRLKDLIDQGACDLSQVHHLVLDEADRMLDMGFEEDVRYIIGQCKSREDGRQTAMFSATWPAAIQKIAIEYMVKPIRVYVGFEAIVGSSGDGTMDDSLSANKRVTQTVEVIEDRARDARLRQLLKQHHGKDRQDRILVFALYKKEAERLEFSLSKDGWKCCSIHGNKQQAARTAALAQFKDGTCPLMIATDVAARGLDIPNVEAVINYTFPLTIEDYVHRIGRTGRAGKTGISHTFFQPGDKSHAGELQQVMKQAGQKVPDALMKFGSTIKKKEHKLYGNFGPTSGPMKKATKITFDF